MKEITNRSALYVIPKGPFKEWAKLHNEGSFEELEDRLQEKHVYLIEWFYDGEPIEILRPYYLEIFEYELLCWNSYKHEWPEDRSLEVFLKWFDVKICRDLYDLENEKIVSERL